MENKNIGRYIHYFFDVFSFLSIGIICLVIVFLFFQIFCFSSFGIPSDSMEPELISGDQIIVNKIVHGARLFNLFASIRGEQVKIHRVPGMEKFQRNEVLVFHFPHPHTWDKLEMHLLQYYIKRCVGIPGDTLQIVNGVYKIAGIHTSLGNQKAQELLACRESTTLESYIYNAFPLDSTLNWNIKEFGPLYIPKAGDKLIINRANYLLYKQLIEWEQQKTLTHIDSTVYIENRPIYDYQFQHNYYFMAGDKCENSQDSRYWGLLPEDFIVGKAWLIWKSVDDYTGNIRWDRILKFIH